MTLFGLQAWFLIKAQTGKPTKHFMKIVLYACITSTLYGVLTEVLQGVFVLLGRSFDYFDMIADALGCLVVYVWFWRKRKQFAQ